MERSELLAEGYEGNGEVAEVEELGIDGLLPNIEATEIKDELPGDIPQLPAESDEGQKPEFDTSAFQSTLDTINSKLEALDAISERVKKTEQRVGGITNRMRDAADEAKRAKEEAPTPEQIEAAAQSKEEREALREEWPEWSKELDKIEEGLAANSAELKKSIPNVDQIQDTIIGSVEEKLQQAQVVMNHNFIELSHKGWTDTVKTDEFKTWMNEQPEEVKALGASYNPLDAISMLTQFEDSKAPGEVEEKIAANKARLNRSVQTKRAGAQTKVKGWGDLTPAEQRKQLLDQGYNK